MNIKSILAKSTLELQQAGSPTPELDVKVLLFNAMEKGSAFVYSHPQHLITNAQYSKFRRYIRRRKKGEPIAYIVGHKEFYGFRFTLNKNVLIPRPESEWLVEKGIEFLSRLPAVGYQLSALDMGTGSGCLAIALSKSILNTKYRIPNTVNIYAVDFNKRGLAIAKKNARRHKPEKIVFLKSDLFSNCRINNKIFDLMIANLPYVPFDDSVTAKNPIFFEPQDAIFAGNNGMAVIKQFLIDAKSRLSPTGAILIELDPRNANSLFNFAKKTYRKAKINLEKDLAGLNRYLIIES